MFTQQPAPSWHIDVFKLKQYVNPITNELECDWLSFYQDHCAEGICEYCRNVDFLVVTTKNGLEVLLPCYKEGKSMLIKTEDDFAKAVELHNM